MNFTIDLVHVRDDFQWGAPTANGSSSGALKMVMAGTVDFAIGKLYMSPKRNMFFDPSTTYYSSPLVIVIPPGKRLSPFEILMKPFSELLWLVLICVLLIAVSGIAILKWKFNETIKNFVFGINNDHPLFNMLSVLIGAYLPRTPNRNFARTLLCIFMLFSLVIRSVYEGALFQFLKSDQRGNMMDTVDEMISEDFDFYLPVSYLSLITDIPKIHNR